MEERNPVLIKSTLKDEQLDKQDQHKELSRAEKKARLAVVLERGVIHDRLAVNLPKHLYGEWVRADPLEIDRMRTLGFHVDEEFSTKRAIHSDGSSGNRVGDVIYMVCDRENKELIDEVRRERSEASNRSPRESREEKEFIAATQAATGGDIPAFSESHERKLALKDVLGKVDNQTAKQE